MSTYPYPKIGTLLFLGADLLSEVLPYVEYLLTENSSRGHDLFKANSHPDYCLVELEDKANWIKIDQIRNLLEWSIGTPQIAQRKVAVVSPADRLNIQSANALLKTLEEPAFNTVFILVASHLEHIPLTIRSRCHIIRFHKQDGFTSNLALKTLVEDQLFLLKQSKTNPLAVSELWSKHDLKSVLAVLYEVIYAEIKAITQSISLRHHGLWAFIDHLSDTMRTLHRQNPPNPQLALDSILIEYVNKASMSKLLYTKD